MYVGQFLDLMEIEFTPVELSCFRINRSLTIVEEKLIRIYLYQRKILFETELSLYNFPTIGPS